MPGNYPKRNNLHLEHGESLRTRIEHDKLILNSHNKVKTTWGIINKESGRNKRRSEIHSLTVEGRKITDATNYC